MSMPSHDGRLSIYIYTSIYLCVCVCVCATFALDATGTPQALPGPLFNLSAYLGAVYKGVPGAFVGWVSLFGPGVMLIFGLLPFWGTVRKIAWFKVRAHGMVNATAGDGEVFRSLLALGRGGSSGNGSAIV